MEIISVIGVILTLLGLFIPSLISNHSSRKAEFRKHSAPLRGKLLSEIEAIEGGSYPFRLISDADFNQLLPYARGAGKTLSLMLTPVISTLIRWPPRSTGTMNIHPMECYFPDGFLSH
ncbi:hypothetical protein BJF97_22180 [Klebsiella sp. LTGPAF-6F]|nr:hypothetical protein BJF97_22180 [Klebsiella sp. LTGPAF-6F]